MNNDGTGNGLANQNTAIGYQALFANTDGGSNTAIGSGALENETVAGFNTAVGFLVGSNVIDASNVTCIGANVGGTNVSNTTWIGNIYGVTTQSGTTAAVIVSDDGQLGTVASSERFKKDIANMQKPVKRSYHSGQSHSTTRRTRKVHRNLV